jgi:hypothetical protein
MPLRSLLMAFAIMTSFACSKSKDSNSSSALPLKAIPSSTVSGLDISLLADKSTGPVTQYGWQLETSSPTDGPVTYSPSSSHKGADFVPIKATITKKGNYIFRLTVYDKDNNLDYQLLTVEVK